MSHGVIKLSPEDAGYTAPGAGEGQKIHESIFVQPYLRSKDKLLTDGFCVPETSVLKIDLLIGQFFNAIQNASFAPFGVVASGARPFAPLELSFGGADRDDVSRYHDEMTYCSTLSPDVLRRAMRPAFEDFLRKLTPLLDAETSARIKLPEKAEKAEKTTIRSDGLTFIRDGKFHDEDLEGADFLTPASHSILEEIDKNAPEVANDRLLVMARSVLVRADLSLGSTRSDVGDFCRMLSELPSIPAKIGYSTLDPKNLVRITKDDMSGARGLLAGAIFRLPEEKRKKICERIKLEETRTPALAT